jgi:regulatory protein
MTEDKVWEKLIRYCAYQERCRKDVQNKLTELKVPTEKQPSLIEKLEEENWLDEKRFAESFVRNKVVSKKWGPIKISYALAERKIPPGVGRKILDSYEEELFRANLQDLMKRKGTGKELEEKEKQSLFNSLLQRGYSWEMILEVYEANS